MCNQIAPCMPYVCVILEASETTPSVVAATISTRTCSPPLLRTGSPSGPIASSRVQWSAGPKPTSSWPIPAAPCAYSSPDHKNERIAAFSEWRFQVVQSKGFNRRGQAENCKFCHYFELKSHFSAWPLLPAPSGNSGIAGFSTLLTLVRIFCIRSPPLFLRHVIKPFFRMIHDRALEWFYSLFGVGTWCPRCSLGLLSECVEASKASSKRGQAENCKS